MCTSSTLHFSCAAVRPRIGSAILQRDSTSPSEVSLWDCSQCSQTSCENLLRQLFVT